MIRISQDSMRPSSLTLEGRRIPLMENGGGFAAYDEAKRESFRFTEGKIRRDGRAFVFEGCAEDLHLTARLIEEPTGFFQFDGEIENTLPGNRAVALSYILPVETRDSLYSNSLNQSAKISSDTKEADGVYPLAALCGEKWGAALAIPPTNPCCFAMSGSAEGLGVTFYLGISPETERFPNKARFSFLVYGVQSAWGFRSALARYYDFLPDYYRCRTPRDGLWLFQHDSSALRNFDQYGFDEVFMGHEDIEQTIQRDEKEGVLTFPYTIVGQREVKFLEKLPTNYQEAMREFEKWKETKGQQITKENSVDEDAYLREQVERCACKKADGEYNILIRNTPWGKDSVTFRINPNPDLFEDQSAHTVGKETLKRAEEWLAKYPALDGVYVDSLGSFWPGTMNYRADHFPYARYPLTFDSEGRVGLHNQISHYEFLETLRDRLRRERGKFLFANGVYCYRPKEQEHYDSKNLGRFFLASLLDVAGAEYNAAIATSVPASLDRWEFHRVCMGKKPYLQLNYRWGNPKQVERYLNLALCFSVFATNNKSLEDVGYLDNPDGYGRDRDLVEWFVENVRKLHRAGWTPITRARLLDGEGVLCERYGEGKTVYFALVNVNEQPRDCALDIDTKALGFHQKTLTLKDVARQRPLTVEPGRKSTKVKVTLDPFKTSVIELTDVTVEKM